MGLRVRIQSRVHLMRPVARAGDVAAWSQENAAKGYGSYPRQVAARRAESAAEIVTGGKEEL